MLKVNFAECFSFNNQKEKALICLPFFIRKGKVVSALNKQQLRPFFKDGVFPQEFKGKREESLLLYLDKRFQQCVLLLGLGDEEELDSEQVKKAYGAFVKTCMKKNWEKVYIYPPNHKAIDSHEYLLEALYSANYVFDQYKKKKTSCLKEAVLLGEPLKKDLQTLKPLYKGVYLARDLINKNADEADVLYFLKQAKALSKKYPALKLKVLGEKELKKLGCHLILAVNKASKKPPAMILFEYRGNPKTSSCEALVGKGVTYDTGGLSLKPSGGMVNMKMDMSGAAAIFGTIQSLCELKVKKNVYGVIPVVENCIGAGSYKVGDVFTAYNKKTVEVTNTDAEGRLILADALAYTAKHLRPNHMIDICTLTGGVVVALGREATGLMSNSPSLSQSLQGCGKGGLDRVWPLPLFREYKKLLSSKIADIKNSAGSEASPLTAGTFLKEFVGECQWAHLDIAGMAYQNKEKAYLPKGATGVGVSLLCRWLLQGKKSQRK